MKASATQKVGSKTQALTGRHSRFRVKGKVEDKYDYSFRRRVDIEEGGGMDAHGWTPIGMGNHDGEELDIPQALQSVTNKLNKTRGQKQVVIQDVILCRRPKEVTRYFKSQEDLKYNAQKRMIQQAAKNIRVKTRQQGFSDQEFKVTGEVTGDFTQRPGLTEE